MYAAVGHSAPVRLRISALLASIAAISTAF